MAEEESVERSAMSAQEAGATTSGPAGSGGAAQEQQQQQQQQEQQQHEEEEQQQAEDRSMAPSAGAASEQDKPKPRRGRHPRGGTYHQTFIPTTRAFLKEVTVSNLTGKDILIPNWLYRVWCEQVGFPEGPEVADGPSALKLRCPDTGRTWDVVLTPHMGGMRLRASCVREMLAALKAKVGSGMLLMMEDPQGEPHSFAMSVQVLPQWSSKDPPPVELPGERVTVSSSRKPGERSAPIPRVQPRLPSRPVSRKRRRGPGGAAAGSGSEDWDSGSEVDEEELLSAKTHQDGPSAARSRRRGAGARMASLLRQPSPGEAFSSDGEGSEEEGEQEEGEEESEEEWAQEQAWTACRAIVRSLLAQPQVKLYFGEPVREEFAPGYYDQIERPMDLGTVLERLKSGGYDDVHEVRADVHLVFANCRQYNSEGHPVRELGDRAEAEFARQWGGKGVERLWEQQGDSEAAGRGGSEASDQGGCDVVTDVYHGQGGWIAEAGGTMPSGDHVAVQVSGLRSEEQGEEAADLLGLWCWQQQQRRPQQRYGRRRAGASAEPAALPPLNREYREYAVSSAASRMPRLWDLAQLKDARKAERYVRLALGMKPGQRPAGQLPDSPANGTAAYADSVSEEEDEAAAAAALVAVAARAAEPESHGVSPSSDTDDPAGGAQLPALGAAQGPAPSWQQQQQQQPATESEQQQQRPGEGAAAAAATAQGRLMPAQQAQPLGPAAARQAAAASSQAGAAAAAGVLTERSAELAQRWVQRAQQLLNAPVADLDEQRMLLPLKCIAVAGFGGEALLEVVQHWDRVPDQEDVYAQVLLEIEEGEQGCQQLARRLELAGFGDGSLASQGAGSAAPNNPQQQQPRSAAAAAALRRLQDRALVAFAEAATDSPAAMLVPLRKLVAARCGAEVLEDTVGRWPHLAPAQQRAAFEVLLVAAAQGAWRHVEARLRLALDAAEVV